MQRLLPLISIAGLILVIGPPAVYLAGALEKDSMSMWMLVGTLVWFVTVPMWMGKGSRREQDG